MPNQNPEQKARDNIDRMLQTSGWVVQSKNAIDLTAGAGQAIREYLSENRVVFDIGGYNYRLVVLVRYSNGVLLIQKIGTHAEYSKWKLT